MAIAVALLAYGGWKTWAWWSPIAVVALLIPMTIYKFYVVNDWRREAQLPTFDPVDFFISIVVNLLILYAVFYLARGIRILLRRQAIAEYFHRLREWGK